MILQVGGYKMDFPNTTQLAVPAWIFSESSGSFGCSVDVNILIWAWRWWDCPPSTLFSFVNYFPIFFCWKLKLSGKKTVCQVQHGPAQLVKIVKDGVKQSGQLCAKIQWEQWLSSPTAIIALGSSAIVMFSQQNCSQGYVSLLAVGDTTCICFSFLSGWMTDTFRAVLKRRCPIKFN